MNNKKKSGAQVVHSIQHVSPLSLDNTLQLLRTIKRFVC